MNLKQDNCRGLPKYLCRRTSGCKFLRRLEICIDTGSETEEGEEMQKFKLLEPPSPKYAPAAKRRRFKQLKRTSLKSSGMHLACACDTPLSEEMGIPAGGFFCLCH